MPLYDRAVLPSGHLTARVAVTDDQPVRAVSRDAFAAEAGASPGLVDWLVEVGVVDPLPDGRFDARDEVHATTLVAMLDAGIRLEDLATVLRDGRFGLRSVARLFTSPAPRTAERYADLSASLGDGDELLHAVYSALGLPQPEPDDHPREDEAELVLGFIRLWRLVDPSGDAAVRAARLVGDGTRRIAEGWLDVWDEVARPAASTQGAPTVGSLANPADPTDPAQNPAIPMADLGRRLVALVHERQVQATLNARILNAIEHVLGNAGRLPPRSARPPAIAFVDLAGFTTLTEEHGDEAAARAATALHGLAETTVRPHEGRIVKQLGDGVLIRFPDAPGALRAVSDLVPAIGAAGLPPAHAGIAAGPVIVRDGDVFGRTVNLAARLAARAGSGDTLVEEGVVVALPRGTARFEPLGRLELAGFADPVAVWRVLPAEATAAAAPAT